MAHICFVLFCAMRNRLLYRRTKIKRGMQMYHKLVACFVILCKISVNKAKFELPGTENVRIFSLFNSSRLASNFLPHQKNYIEFEISEREF